MRTKIIVLRAAFFFAVVVVVAAAAHCSVSPKVDCLFSSRSFVPIQCCRARGHTALDDHGHVARMGRCDWSEN